jgi:hypothetical protein
MAENAPIPPELWVQLSDNGNHIRKWSTAFFEKGVPYVVDRRWPAGAEREADHRAELARKAEPVEVSTVRRGDLEGLDRVISLLKAMAEQGADGGHYDDAWNLRNHLCPFVEGDEHFAAEGE